MFLSPEYLRRLAGRLSAYLAIDVGLSLLTAHSLFTLLLSLPVDSCLFKDLLRE
jgi:hypothetical protein